MAFDVGRSNVVGHKGVVLPGSFVKNLYLLTQILAASTRPFLIRNPSRVILCRAVASDFSLSYQYKELFLSLSQLLQWIALFSHIPCKLKGGKQQHSPKRHQPQDRGDFMLYLLGWTLCQECGSYSQEAAQSYELQQPLDELPLGQVLIPPQTFPQGDAMAPRGCF